MKPRYIIKEVWNYPYLFRNYVVGYYKFGIVFKKLYDCNTHQEALHFCETFNKGELDEKSI